MLVNFHHRVNLVTLRWGLAPLTFVGIYCKIFSTVILLLPLIHEWLLSVASKSTHLCTEYWSTDRSKLAE